MKTSLSFIGLLLVISSVGCATNPWQRNFSPNPAMSGEKFSATASVQIRRVEFERLQRYAQGEKALRVQSTTAPEDLPADEQLAAKNRLLEALQMKERGNDIEVLGWSEFASSERLDPADGTVEQFAKSLGADYVVVASEYGGKVRRTVDRPMTTYSNSYTTLGGPRGRRGGVYSYSDSSTTWVPMNVIEDQYIYSAAFLRKNRN